jgi:hypothetical protein
MEYRTCVTVIAFPCIKSTRVGSACYAAGKGGGEEAAGQRQGECQFYEHLRRLQRLGYVDLSHDSRLDRYSCDENRKERVHKPDEMMESFSRLDLLYPWIRK